ncbi:MAG TPA: hypothetical protein VGD00_00110 [Solirubrobacteraceae bacterium]
MSIVLLLVLPAWLLLALVIAGLCCAARLGDSDGRAQLQVLERERLAAGGESAGAQPAGDAAATGTLLAA